MSALKDGKAGAGAVKGIYWGFCGGALMVAIAVVMEALR